MLPLLFPQVEEFVIEESEGTGVSLMSAEIVAVQPFASVIVSE